MQIDGVAADQTAAIGQEEDGRHGVVRRVGRRVGVRGDQFEWILVGELAEDLVEGGEEGEVDEAGPWG